MEARILLVDDEPDIVEFLQYNLVQEGFEVITAYNGEEAISKMKFKPNLIILDIMMPKLDGYQVVEKIRAMKGFEKIPIIFLTAKSGEIDEVKGLNIGADDYIVKPISPKKLVARVRSNLRKGESTTADLSKKIRIGTLEIDREKFMINLDGETLFFPKKEFEILAYLASRPGKVFSREQILHDIWGTEIFVVERTIDVHIRKIREKLGDYGDYIETIKGVGYRFKNME